MVCVKGSQVFTIPLLYFMAVFNVLSNRLSLLDNILFESNPFLVGDFFGI